MDYTILKNIFLVLTIGITSIYFYWFKTYWLGSSRIYDDFMQFLIKHKNILEKDNFYLKIEEDYKNRTLPELEVAVLVSQINGCEDLIPASEKDKLIHLLNKLESTLESEVIGSVKKGFSREAVLFKYKHIKKYRKLSKRTHGLICTAIIVCTIISLSLTPAANAQTLEKYREKGINSLEERYDTNNNVKDENVSITDRYYRSRLFGGSSYKFRLYLPTPFDEERTLEVDPILYQNKRIGDTLNIRIEYEENIDKYKEEHTYNITDIKILE